MARNYRPRIYDQDLSAREGEPLAVQVIASDRNSGDTLTYQIVSGNDQGLFVIDPLTGIISRADGGAFDFETDATRYDLRVRVTDDGNPPKSRTADVTIRITDVNDAPNEITVSNLSVDENAAGALSARSRSPTRTTTRTPCWSTTPGSKSSRGCSSSRTACPSITRRATR